MAFFDTLDSMLDGATSTASKASRLRQIMASDGAQTSLNDPVTKNNLSDFMPPVMKGQGFDIKNPLNLALLVGGIFLIRRVL